MRILFVSDIHANIEALEACQKYFPTRDIVINLGDVVGYGASPNEVVEVSRKLGSVFIRGNHDKACAGITDVNQFNPVAGVAALWTRRILTPENLEWLKAMPQGPVPVDGVPGTACVHGSPRDEDEYVLNTRDAHDVLAASEPSLIFFGHTHVQGGYVLHGSGCEVLHPIYATADQAETRSLRLEDNAKYLINPGSIGQPRDGDPRAAFALLDTDERSIAYYRVPYDVPGAQKKIREARLPDRLAVRLELGK